MIDGGGYGIHEYADATEAAAGPESGKPPTAGGLTAGWR
jgi:hypothetical protein